MEPYNDSWIYSGSAKERLWNKSAIGHKIHENDLLLSPSEVIFCHDHRHLDWPSKDWLKQESEKNPNLINEAIILEALRVPGNKIMLTKNYQGKNDLIFNGKTWGLRWSSNDHPRDGEPESEVRWFHSSEYIEMNELLLWAIDATSRNRIAEVLIVDNEQAVVTYNITSENPIGELLPPNDKDRLVISKLENIKIEKGNLYLGYKKWPSEQLGIDYQDGRIIDEITEEYLSKDEKDFSEDTEVFSDLLKRGLHPRPGFKYGTEWRCYDKKIGIDHAPWLVVSPSNKIMTWGSACLASRLASGVNKTWLRPLKIDGMWKYLGIIRPPANSRWANPIKK
ncbi:MAG: hypothetical protein CMA98_03305 [Euryarchaeota archaeon]|nr:hypothetical protein [Euryarchaeota archaeon]|tara:strand:- start:1025 stop:2035 length:1011 start_codon:yes stop_codon:yes gene_type:complete